MLELARRDDRWNLHFGGDTLNTAIHLARAGQDVAYLSAIGCDPLSIDLKSTWAADGLDTSLVLEHPARATGLYAVSTDAAGERSFTYWREASAARDMFNHPQITAALHAAEHADLLVFSLISLAILPSQDREKLLELARSVRRRGGKVAFDGNYRSQLWKSQQEAIDARDAAIACADIGLPTLEDERSLTGARDAEAVFLHWRGLGCSETIVKLGAGGCMLPDGRLIPPPAILAPVDTSGAGDAFNGGYIAARLNGDDPFSAVKKGHELAGWCIMRRGAIPPLDGKSPYP